MVLWDLGLALLIGVASLMAATYRPIELPDGHGRGMHGPPWRPGFDLDTPLPWATGPFLLLVVGGVALRRFQPRLGFVLATLGTGGCLALGHPIGPVLLAPAVCLLALARLLPVRSWAPLPVLILPMVLAGFWRDPYLGLLDPALFRALFGVMMLSFLAVLVGVLRRNRNDTQRLEREQELRRYAYEERLRIAREVHDVVGHSLSVINMQAGVALHVLEKRPDQVGPSLEAIRQTSKDALEELRGTLTVFRGAGPDDVRAPQPGLDRLDELVAGLRSAGRHVTVTVAGQPDGRLPPLPTAVDHAAYRIVQEALTNVARHAEGADASVRIGVDGRALIIEVADCSEARRPGPVVAGNGISGMQERARAVGGTLQVGPDAAGRFVVRAELPTVGEGG
ncbi:hypothetical protein GCM10009841_31350 [Microlunatus panaciterrae]